MMDQVGFVEKVAGKISELGLTAPAILLLEAHKPLAFLGSQLLVIAQPTLSIFLGPTAISQTVDLLADPAQLEQLITSLEAQSHPPQVSPSPGSVSSREIL